MSSETKWTPGPWVLSYDKGMGRDVVASPDPKPICTIKQSWVTREQYAANAQLIASAPKLYEALAKFVAHYPMGVSLDLDAAYIAARAAIASARGES